MKFPKVTVAFITSGVLAFLLPIILPVFPEFTYFQNVFMYALYAPPLIFTYGILTSSLSDYLSRKPNYQHKRLVSFMFHVLFGIAFILPYGIIFDPSIFTEGIMNFATISGTFSAVVYFVINKIVSKIN
ncbi:hypothetical protein GGQ92_003290 [Gracilibacillus halotolerans]|uniref:Uncharacterized protein n=1 Tax=Gracilibacillus halotolerans TaxID=74386 RepID=A0A841RPI7_9BACI|nr:hypothetical protein [Gracilibacillus halotolerans]MBB6514439.1 hypothetical protein [Gracilibacillus halotolerans]